MSDIRPNIKNYDSPRGLSAGDTENALRAIARDKAFGEELVPGLHDLAFTLAEREVRRQ